MLSNLQCAEAHYGSLLLPQRGFDGGKTLLVFCVLAKHTAQPDKMLTAECKTNVMAAWAHSVYSI